MQVVKLATEESRNINLVYIKSERVLHFQSWQQIATRVAHLDIHVNSDMKSKQLLLCLCLLASTVHAGKFASWHSSCR